MPVIPDVKGKMMSEQDSAKLSTLNPLEVDQVSGGMNLPPFDPSIRVEDQRPNPGFLNGTSGPLLGGYVTSK